MRKGKYPPHWGRADFLAQQKNRILQIKQEIAEQLWGKGIRPDPSDPKHATFLEAYEVLSNQGVPALSRPERKAHIRRILESIELKNRYIRWKEENNAKL